MQRKDLMEEACQVPGCGKNQDAHRVMAHQFQPSNDVLEVSRQLTANRSIAADPVLRILLVWKGLISYDELKVMEEQLKAAGLLGGPDAGHRQNAGGNRKVRDSPQA